MHETVCGIRGRVDSSANPGLEQGDNDCHRRETDVLTIKLPWISSIGQARKFLPIKSP